MIFDLTDQEKGRLILLSGDRIALDGLKKLFFSTFLGYKMNDINVLAASTLAVRFLDEGLRTLENLKEVEKSQRENGNIV